MNNATYNLQFSMFKKCSSLFCYCVKFKQYYVYLLILLEVNQLFKPSL